MTGLIPLISLSLLDDVSVEASDDVAIRIVPSENSASASRSKIIRTLLLAGILPVVAFTVIEEYYGVIAGLIAGMVLGVGEILYEWKTQRKVETMTWAGNGMLLVLGGVSFFTQEGYWFKLQPAILELVMGLLLVGSCFVGKPFLWIMMLKQGTLKNPQRPMRPGVAQLLERSIAGMTWRLGVFFWIHAGLATWAALYASTSTWALLKGVGFTVSMVLYLLVESLVLRYRIQHL